MGQTFIGQIAIFLWQNFQLIAYKSLLLLGHYLPMITGYKSNN